MKPTFRPTIRTWKLTIEYDGSRYSGWAEQENAPKTIMGELRRVAEELFEGEVDLGGAGRTDAGVHATGQVAHLRAECRGAIPPPDRLLLALNEELPFDIAVVSVEEASPRFHARHDATARAYVYKIARQKDAFSKKYIWWVKERLDLERMRAAAELLAGRHDFVQFRAADAARPDESTVVVVESASIEEQGRLLLFHIKASHFVWRMVRRVTGALVHVGLGDLSVEDFARLLNGRPVRGVDVAAWTAPSSGLFLESVTYRPVVAPHVPAHRVTPRPPSSAGDRVPSGEGRAKRQGRVPRP